MRATILSPLRKQLKRCFLYSSHSGDVWMCVNSVFGDWTCARVDSVNTDDDLTSPVVCLSCRGPCSGPRTLPKISSSCSLQSGNRTQRTSAGSHTRVRSHAHTSPDRLTCPVSQENDPSEGLNVLSIRSGSLSVAADNKKVLTTLLCQCRFRSSECEMKIMWHILHVKTCSRAWWLRPTVSEKETATAITW